MLLCIQNKISERLHWGKKWMTEKCLTLGKYQLSYLSSGENHIEMWICRTFERHSWNMLRHSTYVIEWNVNFFHQNLHQFSPMSLVKKVVFPLQHFQNSWTVSHNEHSSIGGDFWKLFVHLTMLPNIKRAINELYAPPLLCTSNRAHMPVTLVFSSINFHAMPLHH